MNKKYKVKAMGLVVQEFNSLKKALKYAEDYNIQFGSKQATVVW